MTDTRRAFFAYQRPPYSIAFGDCHETDVDSDLQIGSRTGLLCAKEHGGTPTYVTMILPHLIAFLERAGNVAWHQDSGENPMLSPLALDFAEPSQRGRSATVEDESDLPSNIGIMCEGGVKLGLRDWAGKGGKTLVFGATSPSACPFASLSPAAG